MSEDIEKFISLIRKQRDLNQSLYLLVDPLKPIFEDYLISIPSLRKCLGEENIVLVPRKDLMHEPNKCPHLVKIAPQGEDIAEIEAAQEGQEINLFQTIQGYSIKYACNEPIGEKRYVCGWLQSALDTGALAENLALRMEVEYDGNRKIYPLHEPLRLELMSAVCSASDSSSFEQWLNPISSWIIPSGHRGFAHLKAQAGEVPILPTELMVAQADAPLVAQGLAMWTLLAQKPMTAEEQDEFPLLQRGERLLPQSAAYQFYLNIKTVHKAGVNNRQDLLTLALLKCVSHPHFEKHPIIKQMIADAIQTKVAISDQLKTIDHFRWCRILQELDSYRA